MTNDIPAAEIEINGASVKVDLDEPVLPIEIRDGFFESGGFPYPKKKKRAKYESELSALQLELVKFQREICGKREKEPLSCSREEMQQERGAR